MSDGVAATVGETERWLLVQVVISSVVVLCLYILAAWAQLGNSPMRAHGSQGESRRRCEVGFHVVIGQLSGKREVETEVSEA